MITSLEETSRTTSQGATSLAPTVLDVWSHIEPSFGGVGPAASALATAVAAIGRVRSRQVAICNNGERLLADGINPEVARIVGTSLRGLADARLTNALRVHIAESAICHVHGLWLPHSLAARKLASEMGKPVVSSVHGMLEAWELRHKQLKKSLYAAFFERPSLGRSSCLRALSEREVGDYRRFGCRAPVALIPNGIEPLPRVEPSLALEFFPQLRDKAVILFLGRVHQKKGVLNLLQAWKHVARRNRDAHLVVTGPECGDTGRKVRNLVAESDLAARVTITGVLSGPRKLSLLSYARYLCLPSYSEGLSVAVLEALSIGLPSIVTPECNIPLVGVRGAGRITANQPSILADTIISCLEASDRERDEMSRAGRKLARDEYDWSTVARSMQSVYEWMLGGIRPACVVE